MPHKIRIITTTKRTDQERIEYWVVQDNGDASKCSPMAWHKLKLDDQTMAKALESAARIRYHASRPRFGQRVDDLRALRVIGQDNAPDAMQQNCVRLGITF